MRRLAFVVPADLARPTGGNHYDRALAAALTRIGVHVELRPVPGAWPVASAADRARLGRALTAADPVLADGLLACGAPTAVTDAVSAGTAVHVLVHLPLALETGLGPELADARNALEHRALRAASGVVATSPWTADDLRRRHGLTGVAVATPGARRAPLAPGSTPPLLRHVAAVCPLKDQLTVVAALAQLRAESWSAEAWSAESWSAELTGATDVDPGYTAAVRTAIEACRLSDRVRLTGPLTGQALEKAWDATDLALLVSRSETWGMAVTEALTRGIPAVVGRGTGAELSLGRTADGDLPGALVPPGSAADLAGAIRTLLGPAGAAARRAARTRRAELPGWRETAEAVRAALS